MGSKNPLNRDDNSQWWYVFEREHGFQTYSWGGAENLYQYLTHVNEDGHSVAKQTRVVSSRNEKSQPFVPGGATSGDVLFYNFGDDDSSTGKEHAAVVAGIDKPYGLDTSKLPPQRLLTNHSERSTDR